MKTTRTGTKINAGEKIRSAKALAYHEDTADDLESDAIESDLAVSTVSLGQVLSNWNGPGGPGGVAVGGERRVGSVDGEVAPIRAARHMVCVAPIGSWNQHCCAETLR